MSYREGDDCFFSENKVSSLDWLIPFYNVYKNVSWCSISATVAKSALLVLA